MEQEKTKKLSDGYDVDVFEQNNKGETTEFLALTERNVNFVEAVIKLDSNYKNESLSKKPDEGFDSYNYKNNTTTKYCGSIRFWFEQMTDKGSKYGYKTCVLGAVIAIDRSNSTHLEIANEGRQQIANRIIYRCSDVEKLKEALGESLQTNPEKDFDKNHLLAYMIDPKITDKNLKLELKKQGFVFPLSFASKFCSYAAHFLLNDDTLYSKYDNVVVTNLPYYIEKYLNKKVKKSEFLINNTSEANKNREDSDGRFKFVLNQYIKYSNEIQEIINTLSIKNLNKNTLDHIIWYGNKG